MKKGKPTSQMTRFQEAATQLGCPQDDSVFDKVLKKIASAPPPKSVEKRKTRKPTK